MGQKYEKNHESRKRFRKYFLSQFLNIIYPPFKALKSLFLYKI